MKENVAETTGSNGQSKRGTVLYFWGESPPKLHITEKSETSPDVAIFGKDLLNWSCVRLPFLVRSLACGDEHFAVVSSTGLLFVSSV